MPHTKFIIFYITCTNQLLYGLFFGMHRQSKVKQYASCCTYPYFNND